MVTNEVVWQFDSIHVHLMRAITSCGNTSWGMIKPTSKLCVVYVSDSIAVLELQWVRIETCGCWVDSGIRHSTNPELHCTIVIIIQLKINKIVKVNVVSKPKQFVTLSLKFA